MQVYICKGKSNLNVITVAGPGFDLRGRGLCQRGEGKKSLKVLKVEVKVIYCFGNICIKIMLKSNRERRKIEKNSLLGIKNHR